MRYSPLIALLSFLGSAQEGGSSPVVQIHGSGASNPSRCYWHVLDAIEAHTKIPTRMTYRATGSGNGQTEFVGEVDTPFNDFASGDYPMTQERYQTLKEDGIEMIHLPVLLGAIGVFHSVPVKLGHTLNMTSCLLARVFKREITDWQHADIAAINPNMDIPIKYDNYGNYADDQSFAISVARRLLGSSSTYGFTQYLHKACPENWQEDMVGSTIEWDEETKICHGTSGMVDCVREAPGTIGYIDSGLGHDEGLDEVALRMDNIDFRNNDFYLTSENSIRKGGILPVLDEEAAHIPDTADADWSGVDLINQVEGFVYTWPMVGMTYIYVRKDLPSFIPDPQAQTLLIAFLKSLYDENYVEVCESRFKFVRVEGNLKQIALAGIDLLQTSEGAPEWTLESGDVQEGGQGDYVISTRRKRSSGIEQEILIGKVEQSSEELQYLRAHVDALEVAVARNHEHYHTTNMNATHHEHDFGNDERRRLDATFVLTLVSLILWLGTATYIFILRGQMNIMASSSVVRPQAGQASVRGSSCLRTGPEDCD